MSALRKPHLELVTDDTPAKPKRRRRKLAFKIGKIFRPRYGANPVLLRWEEECVMRAFRKDFRGEHVTLPAILDRHPGRWNRTYLWRTLVRLAKTTWDGETGRRPGRLHASHTWLLDRRIREGVTFWLPPTVALLEDE